MFQYAKNDHEMSTHIGYHFDKILEIGQNKNIETVVELGCRSLCSATIWLQAKIKNIYCYDIYDCLSEWNDAYTQFEETCKLFNLNFIFKQCDSTKIEIPECDILFVDTIHTYSQVITELNLHHNKVNKYIIIHDSYCDEIGDDIQSRKGVRLAIEEFLNKNENWEKLYEIHNSNGLTILYKK